MTQCWQISGLPKMLLRGQRLDTFGWVICKCQSLPAIREQAGSNGCILTKARRAFSRPAASKPPDPAAATPPGAPEPRRPAQLSKFSFDFIPLYPPRTFLLQGGENVLWPEPLEVESSALGHGGGVGGGHPAPGPQFSPLSKGRNAGAF